MTEAVIVKVKHFRHYGLCLIPGVKYFFQRNGLDFKKFIKDGIPYSELERLNDPLLTEVLELAKNEQG